MTNYVIINGVNSNTINGLGINELPPITKPQMRVQNEEIDGRDGDITTNLGYSAYDKTITIGLFGTGYDINDIVAFFNGEGTIVFSNEADKYYNFKIINQIDYVALQKFKSATITFHCQPFKYPLTETPLEIEYSYIEDEGENLTLNDTAESTLELNLKGNTSQTGTPTPSTPIPVNVVSGDNEVVVCGKNLYDESQLTLNTTQIDNKTCYEIAGTTASTRNIIWNKELKENTQYTISMVAKRVQYFNHIVFYYTDGTNDYKNFTNTDFQRISATSTANKTITKIQVDTGDLPAKNYIEVGTIQLEESSTASEYEPYQSQTYEVDLRTSKNLLSLDEIIRGIELNSDNGQTMVNASWWTSGYIAIKPNTAYTTSGVSSVTKCWYDKHKNFISMQKSTTATSPNNAKYLRVNGTIATLGDNLQIEAGSTATTYEPYSSIELCKIGTYQDYFTKNSDGQWCKYNAIGKLVLDENSGMETAGTSTFRIPSDLVSNLLFPATNTNLLQAYVNYLQIVTWSSEWSDYTSFISAPRNPNDRIRIRVENQTTLTDLNNWLSTHNIIIYYVLATPYLSLIEDNNLIEQLDNLQNAMSYSGTTNINQVNDDKAFIISTKALEQGSNEVVVNNIGNTYSKPLIALEGSGNVDIYLGNTQILKANVEDKMNIDIAKLEAYNPDTSVLLNRQVIGNYNSMTLQPGNNTIRIDGALDKATISNYTRWI